MTRGYRLQQRAVTQQATRQRIVEAAVALHTTIGPARSSVSEIARQAGVERHTFYNYFPDERTLLAACSDLRRERRPLPDPESWRPISDGERRLRRGLGEVYAFYERNGDALAPIVRDAATHAPTQEIFKRTVGKQFSRMRDVLVEPFEAPPARRRRLLAVLELFLSLDVWRLLSRTTRSRAEAVDVAVRAVRGQSREEHSRPREARRQRSLVAVKPKELRKRGVRHPPPPHGDEQEEQEDREAARITLFAGNPR